MSDIIYFDNAATTYPKPDEVYRAMDSFYREYGFNAGRGQYPQAYEVNKVINETREALRKLFNCLPDQQVVFTHSATEATNVILQGLDWDRIHNVYITHFEHNAVLRVLHQIKKIKDINIYHIHTEKESKDNKILLSYDLERIKYQFQDIKPDLVIMTHASNVCGLITPIEEIATMAKEYDAEVVIDCAQTAGLLTIDLHKLNADYIIFAGHKTLYGPFGIGGFTISGKSKLRPLIYGGTGIDSANMEMPISIPDKFEAGSRNIQAIVGLNVALKWLENIGREYIEKREQTLLKDIIRIFDTYEKLVLITTDDNKNQVGILSCFLGQGLVSSIGHILTNNNIAVRTGLHCAPNTHRFLNTIPDGTIRFSLSFLNKDIDICKLREVFDDIYIEMF